MKYRGSTYIKCWLIIINLILLRESVSGKFYEFGRRPQTKSVVASSHTAVLHKPTWGHLILDKRYFHSPGVEPENPPVVLLPIAGVQPDHTPSLHPFLAEEGYASIHWLRGPPMV
jgi:hypothetical protein